MKYILLLGLLFSGFYLHAQSIGSYVITSAGKSIMNENGGLYFSIGEPINTELGDGDFMISQGFLQIVLEDEGTYTKDELESTFKIFPNPASNELNIKLIGTTESYKAILVNAIGEKIAITEFESKFQKLDINTLTPGIYYLNLFKEDVSLGSYSIIKQ